MTLQPQILIGDCREQLKTLPAESVQCVITSPPYFGLRNYGVSGQIGLEETPVEYVQKLVEVFSEVWRVLKRDGVVWLNLGDSYAGGGGFSPNAPSNTNSRAGQRGAAVYGVGLGIKPQGTLKPKDLVGIPWRVAFALQDYGWYLRSEIIWSKPNAMPESVTDRPTKAHETIFLLSKQERYYYNADAIREPNTDDYLTWKTKRGTNEKYQNNNQKANHLGTSDYNPQGRNKRTVWEVPTQPYSGSHFAVFPEKLMEPMVLAGSRPGDTILDPFCGSGTTLRVAIKHQRNAIGIELNPEYVKLVEERTDKVQMRLAI